ncbi:MAG: STAS domain-containing protein [Acidimicrobiales bacterium]
MIEPFFAAFDVASGVLTVRGELDEGTAPHVYALRFGEARVRHIDAAGVTFLGAGGVTALLDCCKSVPTTIDASPQVRRLIELCALDHILVVVPHTPKTPATLET